MNDALDLGALLELKLGTSKTVLYITSCQLKAPIYSVYTYKLDLTKIPYQFFLTHGGKKQQSEQVQLHCGRAGIRQRSAL